MLVTVILFILLLGVLVLAHEWGHFIVARKLGIRVEEFAFGFPPRLASITRKGTRYALNLFPLGGYVKIFGEGGEADANPESFSSRPVWQRFWVIAAGVFMNIILAWFLFSLGHGLGLPTVITEEASGGGGITIVAISGDSPAEKAGVRFGDVIEELAIWPERRVVERLEDVQEFIHQHRGEEIDITLRRGQERVILPVRARGEPPAGEGPLGIAMARVGIVRSPWWRAPLDGLKTTASAAITLIRVFGRALSDFFSRGQVPQDISGPIGIFFFTDQARQLGTNYLLEIAGVLSVSLAFFNILPIPGMDGGRILFLGLEKIRGAKINQRIERIIHTGGIILLLVLVAVVSFHDVIRYF